MPSKEQDGTSEKWVIQNLGSYAYSMKTLNGMFFENETGEVLLISGTETTEGAQSEAFVYDCDNQNLLYSEKIDDACSFTGFCNGEHGVVYFGSISRGNQSGCNLYSYDCNLNAFRKLAHFQEKGIYSLDYKDGNVYVSTSEDVALYRYNVKTEECVKIIKGFTEQPYAFSTIIGENICYVSIGTKPEIFAIDIKAGQCRNLLPERYKAESSVMGLTRIEDNIFFLLSPSCKVIKMDLLSETFIETELRYNQSSVQNIDTDGLLNFYNFYGDTILEYNDHVELVSNRNKCSYGRINNDKVEIYGLNISGIITKQINGEELFSIDLCQVLSRSYCIPLNALAVNDILYIPERRFQVCDLHNNYRLTHLIIDEPQAATYANGRVYTANYTECTIYEYPVKDLLNNSKDINMNGTDYLIADIDNQCRPRQMDISCDGRYLVLGSGPLYGKWGGYCSVYDIENQKLLYSSTVLENHLIQSVRCSKLDSNLVWLGTSPYGENTSPLFLEKESSHLILWDIEESKILLDIIPEEGMRKIGCICDSESTVYCVTQAGHLFSYNATTGQKVAANTDAIINKVIMSNDGIMYGIDLNTVYSINRESLEPEIEITGFASVTDIIMDSISGQLYVVDGTEIKRISKCD